MQIFSKSDKGKVRQSNQDAFFASLLSDGSAFIVVCDGMGGANAGNVASENAVKIISDYVLRSYRTGMDEEEKMNMIKNAITSANIVIYDMSLKDPLLSGMGTTVVTALAFGETAVVCHVGDSRAYVLDQNNIVQITRDHSIVQSLLESGKLTPDEAKVHPRKNVITRALGAEESVIPDGCIIPFEEGKTLLLCTDGLTNFVDSNDIFKIFNESKSNNAADELVARANDNGGGDNITVVTVTNCRKDS